MFRCMHGCFISSKKCRRQRKLGKNEKKSEFAMLRQHAMSGSRHNATTEQSVLSFFMPFGNCRKLKICLFIRKLCCLYRSNRQYKRVVRQSNNLQCLIYFYVICTINILKKKYKSNSYLKRLKTVTYNHEKQLLLALLIYFFDNIVLMI